MTDEPHVTKRQEQVLRALMAEKLAAGEGIAAIRVICGNGSPGIGGAAEGLTTRSSKEVSA
jgi:hypothetical protein